MLSSALLRPLLARPAPPFRPVRTGPSGTRPARAFASSSRARNAAPAPAAVDRAHALSAGERAIADKLHEQFAPSRLDVEDVSGGCGTFYAITIQSAAFAGLGIVQQHRLVTKVLKADIEGIHGLQLKTIPDEPRE